MFQGLGPLGRTSCDANLCVSPLAQAPACLSVAGTLAINLHDDIASAVYRRFSLALPKNKQKNMGVLFQPMLRNGYILFRAPQKAAKQSPRATANFQTKNLQFWNLGQTNS